MAFGENLNSESVCASGLALHNKAIQNVTWLPRIILPRTLLELQIPGLYLRLTVNSSEITQESV